MSAAGVPVSVLAGIGFEAVDSGHAMRQSEGTGTQICARKHHGMSRLASFGDASLYGVYATAHDQVFDSDETIPKVDYNINADVAISNAEKLLRLVVADRKVLLEHRPDILPASIRVDRSLDEYDSFSVDRTKELVDNIISGKFVSASQAAEADLENITANVYIDQFIEASERVCRLSERLLEPLKVDRPKIEAVVTSSPTRMITRTVNVVPKQQQPPTPRRGSGSSTLAAHVPVPTDSSQISGSSAIQTPAEDPTPAAAVAAAPGAAVAEAGAEEITKLNTLEC